MKMVGDTIVYRDGSGRDVSVEIAGTYPSGVFHGNAIMSIQDFKTLWPEETGVEEMLVKSSDPEAAGELLSIAMSEYGLSIQNTTERIRGLARINREKLDIVSEFRFTDGAGACFSHPSIFDGILYIRRGTALAAYKIK